MQRRCSTPLMNSLRCFSSNSSTDKVVASVLFERLPIVVPKIDPIVYAFQEFSFRWKQQYRREYPDEFYKKYESRGKGDYQIDYKPASRITEADKTNDRRFRWKQQYRREYPDEFYKKYESRGKGDYQIDYKPASRITEADKTNDRRFRWKQQYRREYPDEFYKKYESR